MVENGKNGEIERYRKKTNEWEVYLDISYII